MENEELLEAIKKIIDEKYSALYAGIDERLRSITIKFNEVTKQLERFNCNEKSVFDK